MSKIKKSGFFTLITISYAILILYLSVTSNLGGLKYFLRMNLGYKTKDVLVENNLSFVMDFLLDSLEFAQSLSIDPGHLVVYFGFGVLLYLVFSNSKNALLIKNSAVCAICTGTAFGILNEIFQTYLPFRVASVADVISNLVGLTIAQIFTIVFILGLKGFLKIEERQ